MRVLGPIAVCLTLVFAGGCGGSAREPTDASGRTLFVESGCGDCHTLAAAGTAGTVGPNLDVHGAHHSRAQIEEQIRRGGRTMPAFEERLTDEQISAVAEFVHTAAGGPPG